MDRKYTYEHISKILNLLKNTENIRITDWNFTYYFKILQKSSLTALATIHFQCMGKEQLGNSLNITFFVPQQSYRLLRNQGLLMMTEFSFCLNYAFKAIFYVHKAGKVSAEITSESLENFV